MSIESRLDAIEFTIAQIIKNLPASEIAKIEASFTFEIKDLIGKNQSSPNDEGSEKLASYRGLRTKTGLKPGFDE